MKLLLVEDDIGVGRLIQRGAAQDGHTVDWRVDAESARAALADCAADVIVLDRMLGEEDGADLCRWARSQGLDTPILMLTARGALEDKLSGFDAGADDYLAKPFSFDELMARLSALGRRAERQKAEPRPAGLRLDRRALEARIGERRLALSLREFALLDLLNREFGAVVTREAVISRAWGGDELTPNSVDVYVGYLRRKLDEARAGVRIVSVRGAGYRLVGSGWS
jgi:DNA-binding response OmpR family regulator